ncbi:TetR family transcriptional regulator [Kribbella voronezhensis]|uniref:TetR family transcriptional regulator n=1 Tax=Kribbella voronezhensis TaxID=2512212 RepID=A0A4R7SVN4_9ACTN|nr:TetR/AcrR family transcriptional regulator C-terminal domain-containing protein [Kribbella voronezhensis]TDU83231.1 TetR family transcriptional regulator [Kribbella voronezhensis]
MSAVIWDRPEPAKRPAPSPLSRESIVQAAIRLADAEGLEAVSVRKVAAELDAGPMRLYGYLSTKDDLLDLMVDTAYGEILLPESSGQDWRSTLRALAHGIRQVALRHEWFADLLGRRPHLGPHALAYLEASLAALDRADEFENIDAVSRAVRTLNAYLIGALRAEVAERRAERSTGLDKDSWRRKAGPYLTRTLASGDFPTVAKFVHDASRETPDSAFDEGLNQLLDGITPGRAG